MNISELEKEAYLALKRAKRNSDSKQADKDLREFMDKHYPLDRKDSLINKEIRNNIFNLWEVWNTSNTPCSPVFHHKVDTNHIIESFAVPKELIQFNVLNNVTKKFLSR